VPILEAHSEGLQPSDPPSSANGEPASSMVQAGSRLSSRFSRYLTSLSTKPSQDPMLDYLESDTGTIPNTSTNHRRSGSNAIGQAGSSTSLAILAGNDGDGGHMEGNSYGYMEMLLEALAVMGRLGSALEVIAQRVSGEVHTLVETTLDEVEERCAACYEFDEI
jgi:exocyst complex component 4